MATAIRIIGAHDHIDNDGHPSMKATRFTDTIGRVWVASTKGFAGRWTCFCEARRGLTGTFSSQEIKANIVQDSP